MTAGIFQIKHINNNKLKELPKVNNSISDDFADYINFWKHNGYRLFDSPETIRDVTKENSLDLSNTNLDGDALCIQLMTLGFARLPRATC